jgi:hypothetical protein
MTNQGLNIDEILSKTIFKEIFDSSRLNYALKEITKSDGGSFEVNTKILRFTHVVLSNELSKLENNYNDENEIDCTGFEKLFYLFRSIDLNIIKEEFDALMGYEGIPFESTFYFYLAISGLLSKNNIKARIDLKSYSIPINESGNWEQQLVNSIMNAIILLTRKSNGHQDIQLALEIIEQLRQQQNELEKVYLQQQQEVFQQINKAINLIGYYHLCKVLTETALYLIQGFDYKGNLHREIQRHSRYAREIFDKAPRLISFSIIIEQICITLQRNSIWFRTANISSSISQLCRKLGNQQMLDLLPSQQKALESHLLDPTSSATIVQMPTSAGKTLLAEFSILQLKALNENAKIVYVVPTKALMNQLLADLRDDFSELKYIIEKSSGANEVDPSEDLFLKQNIDVLIVTPEKLDLLVRKKHTCIQDLSLVIVDEAHTINDGERGARLELLLAIVKREMPNTRFILLSPFLRNAELLKSWLAEGKNAITPIKVDWKPSDKVYIGISEYKKEFRLEFLPSVASTYISSGVLKLDNKGVSSTGKKERLFEFTSKYFSNTQNSSILYLCWGKKTADTNAEKLYGLIQNECKSELIDLAIKFIIEELGEPTTLTKVLKKGIAIHHSGLTDDVKQLIEFLIKKRQINHICATTTIAQGMNFPVSTVYFDDTRKGDSGKHLSISEFQNIAGRAGRTLVDSIGKIVFPFNSVNNIAKANSYISGEAEEITSALVELILNSEEIIHAFSSENNPTERAKLFDKNQSLSTLVQYLIHVLNISNEKAIADEIEELFKDSLGYFMLDQDGKNKFISICRTLYTDMQIRLKPGVLKFADKTGFCIPSVLSIMYAKSSDPAISNTETWMPENLFNTSNDFLTKKIDVIGKLREVKLGTESASSPFNPELIANIITGWVNGENVSKLSSIHPYYKNETDNGKRMNEFVKYLSSTLFKSSWGLSALEGIVRSNNEDIAENSHIPSMVYYGVNSKNAVAMRMMGAPRSIANNIAEVAFDNKEPSSFNDVRKRIISLSNAEWEAIKPKHSSLSGEEWKTITNILMK